jgi:hypothetical protein
MVPIPSAERPMSSAHPGRVFNQDQVLSDADQVAAYSDQQLSNAAQAADESDQASADRDQLASDRDQASADVDHEAAVDLTDEQESAYQDAREERDEGSIERVESRSERARTTLEREGIAADRGQVAGEREARGRARDHRARLSSGPPSTSFSQQRLATATRLIAEGADLKEAAAWCDAWEQEAAHRGVPRGNDYWTLGTKWIAAERVTRQMPGEDSPQATPH